MIGRHEQRLRRRGERKSSPRLRRRGQERPRGSLGEVPQNHHPAPLRVSYKRVAHAITQVSPYDSS